MARDHYDLDEMKKKPSALLVYLTLEQNRGNGPMGRQDIIDYIKEHFGGIEIQPKTVSESVAILKALKEMDPSLIDFQQFGKNGYYLGRAESVFTLGETLRILEYFSSVGAGDEAWKALESLMSQKDIKSLRTIQQSFVRPRRKRPETKSEQEYIEKIEIIGRAIESKHEVIFDHVFSDTENNRIKTELDVHVSPYFLFTKNGRFYLLGGRLGDRSKGIWKSLYVADIANIEHVKISSDDIEPWSYSFPMEHVESHLNPYPSIREGEYHHTDYGRCKIHVTSKRILMEINALFGECYTITKQFRKKRDGHFVREYIIDFYGNYRLAFMLLMRFPTGIDILELPQVYRKDLVDRATVIARRYSSKEKPTKPDSFEEQ